MPHGNTCGLSADAAGCVEGAWHAPSNNACAGATWQRLSAGPPIQFLLTDRARGTVVQSCGLAKPLGVHSLAGPPNTRPADTCTRRSGSPCLPLSVPCCWMALLCGARGGVRPADMLQVCSKIVETERGVATTYKGNYTQYVQQKEEAVAKQWTMFEKWNKEVQKQKDIIRR